VSLTVVFFLFDENSSQFADLSPPLRPGTPSGSEDRFSLPSPPSSRCGSPSRSTTRLDLESCIEVSFASIHGSGDFDSERPSEPVSLLLSLTHSLPLPLLLHRVLLSVGYLCVVVRLVSFRSKSLEESPRSRVSSSDLPSFIHSLSFFHDLSPRPLFFPLLLFYLILIRTSLRFFNGLMRVLTKPTGERTRSLIEKGRDR